MFFHWAKIDFDVVMSSGRSYSWIQNGFSSDWNGWRLGNSVGANGEYVAWWDSSQVSERNHICKFH